MWSGFRPIVRSPKEMDCRIFGSDPIGLEEMLLQIDFGERVSYDAGRHLVFLNLVGHQIMTRDDVDRMRHVLTEYYRRLRPGFSVVVDYDDFRLDDRVAERYFAMIESLAREFGYTVTRYTTSAFLRAKLGDGLARRNLAAHIFERRAEAHAFVTDHRVSSTTVGEGHP